MSNVQRITQFCSVFLLATAAQGADFELHPFIAVSEEYTDNVFATNTNSVSDYITRTLPGLGLSYKAPVLTVDLSYSLDYRHYAKKTVKDDTTHLVSAKGHFSAVENFLYLDVSDEYQRVSLSAIRDVTNESLFVNQSDRNVATASPYLTLHPTERIFVKPGYSYVDTRYYGSTGVDKTDHIVFMNMSYEISKKWSLTADYTFIRELAENDKFSQHLALGGFRYEYTDKSFAFAQAGKTWIDYDTRTNLNNALWNAGITQIYNSITATITTGVKYNEDPLSDVVKESFISGNLEMRFQRGNLILSPYYSEFVPTIAGIQHTKKYSATVRSQYELTSDLIARLVLNAEKYEQKAYVRRYQVDTGINYLLAKLLTASLSYIYVNYYSPDASLDNRQVNRVIVEIKKTF